MAYNKKYATLGESVIDYVNDREDAIETSFNDIVDYVGGKYTPLDIVVGGISSLTLPTTTKSVRLIIKLGSNEYFQTAFIPEALYSQWILLKDNNNNSVLFKVTSDRKIELWSGSQVGSKITGVYEY